ncbi:MAG: preprotein translocase subunit SecA [bacterium]|nr:preprotein translocase subunit SecA [bacterium]
MSLISKIFGDANNRFLKGLEPMVREINALEDKFAKLSGGDLKKKTEEFRNRLNPPAGGGETLDDIAAEAFACVREAAKRTLKQRHFDVQLMGGMALREGKIAEMKTGEGKTLVATLPAYLNALTAEGVHIVTVNDYLSRRDAVWMGQIYDALGLSVGCLNHEQSFLYDATHYTHSENQERQEDEARDTLGSFKVVHEFLKPCTRQEAYAADITYGTNNEYGFDYLKDSMAYDKEQLVQRAYNFAIVDEIDSILIDEARTPLIISAPDTESEELYSTFSHIVPRLKENSDYTVDEKMKAISITESGIEAVENMLGIKDIYTEKGIKYVHHLEQALRAQALFRKDKDYVVKNGEIIIVDEFTGRLMPGRRWSEGLHQAIEAKEGVQVQKESRTLASITFQNYFRMYKKLAGMTGTAFTSAEEFSKVYNLEVAIIPTNKPMIRTDYPDLVYQSEKGKFLAVAEEIKNLHKTGQPVLVGTVSIEKNEYLSALLKKDGVSHRVLNAKHHEEEGEIIAQAGRKGGVTIATNMAGRGVDIVLGGNPPDAKEGEEIKNTGGLFVIGTERHEARRIDNQLRGRGGRQGDSGKTRFYVSLEDDLMRIFGSGKIKNMMGRFGIPEDQPIENRLVSKAIESAQSKIEGFNFDARKHILDYDNVMNVQRNKIYGWRRQILFSDNDSLKEIIKEIFSARGGSALGGEKEGKDFELLEKHRQEMGDDTAFFNMQRFLLLRVIDMLWVDHLETMEYMRSSVGLRAYGQRDPLVEYKNEGSRLFKALESAIRAYYAHLSLQTNSAGAGAPASASTIQLSKEKKSGSKGQIGRNDSCPCGSGKKYKKCHGK